jgi:cell division protein FtsZ
MLEINEAANIITENIDPNAKVIFGAVNDDQIRKGDIHITVVATGFDANRVSEGSLEERLSQISAERKEKAEEKKEKITFPSKRMEPKMIIEEKVQPRGVSVRSETKQMEEEDELEIPAFIRRKMKK